MRCGCPVCGTYMVHADDSHLGCVCPECNNRCTACLGTDTVLSRDELLAIKNTEWFDVSTDSMVDSHMPPLPNDDGHSYDD